MIELNKIYNLDCVEGMKLLPDNFVDLVLTSPPYSVGIKYDVYKDDIPIDEYFEWTKEWLTEVYRTLKPDGRIALNVPIEVNIKERGGRIFMSSEIWQIMKQVGFKFFGMVDLEEDTPHRVKHTAWGCYDDKTRVMTQNGLKLFKDVDINIDKFLTINPITKEIEYQKAFNYIEKPYSGNLVGIHNKSAHLNITPNHNILHYKNGKLNVTPFNEIDSDRFIIPRTHNGLKNTDKVESIEIPPVDYGVRTKKKYINRESIKIDMDIWLKFLGVYLTDGSLIYNEQTGEYRISIYQKKEKYLNKITSLLEQLPFDFKYKKEKYEYYTCSKQLASFLVDTNNKNLRTIPEYVFNVSRQQKEIFIKWLFYGDGSFRKNGDLWKISVCSETMTNQITQLLFEIGRRCSLYKYNPKTRIYKGKLMKSNYPMTTITILNNKDTYINGRHITQYYYEGNVYCVSVPNKTLLIECGGQLTWCGNSWLSASSPYIYNPKECVILAYKEFPKKQNKGQSQWDSFNIEVDGKIKKTYSEEDKKEFMSLVFGRWHYESDKQQLTKATFSLDIPLKAIKILTYKGDLVMDPFGGSGTSLLGAKMLGRNYIGFELSPNYVEIADKRIEDYIKQQDS